MDSVLIGILVAVVAWLFMRHMRMRSLRPRPQGRVSAPPADTPKTMPRIGMQGSVTKDQLRRLKALHFETSPLWSSEEANLILDAVAYLRAAIVQVTGENEAPEEIQNQILAFILSDDALREYMIGWGRHRRDTGAQDSAGPLEQNEHFERVAALVNRIVPGKGT